MNINSVSLYIKAYIYKKLSHGSVLKSNDGGIYYTLGQPRTAFSIIMLPNCLQWITN